MTKVRTVEKVIKSRPTVEGAGVQLRRAFGGAVEAELFDPFLLLDDFRSDNPDKYLAGFPWHPHRGIETITYVLEGRVEHGDSIGNEGAIGPGDIQWMTAGSGIIHQEMPKGDESGRMGGFQLWANLPASEKMMDPRYRGISASDVPVAELENGVTVRVICGRVGETEGAVSDIVIDPSYLDIEVPAGVDYTHATKPGHTVFAYVIDGSGSFCDRTEPFAGEVKTGKCQDTEPTAETDNHTLVLFGDGDSIRVSAGNAGIRFLLISGKPIQEPIAWYGPIVMNTQEELQTAFEEYRNGTFVKKGQD